MINREAMPIVLIIAMGLADCITTIIGISFRGATELNPAMAVVVNSSVDVFAIIKVAATMFIALTYIFARKILMHLPDRDGKTFVYSMKGLIIIYFGLVGFLGLSVVNNLIVLLH